MKTLIYILLIMLSFSATAQEKKPRLLASCETRGCSGTDFCSACKNCSGCKHCAKEGGTCGVCSAPVKKKSVVVKSKKRIQKGK